MLAPTILSKDARQCVARWNNVLIQVRRGELTLEGLADLQRHLTSMALRHTGPKGVFGVMEPGAPIPSQEVRAAQMAVYRTALSSEGGWFGVVVIPPEGVAAPLKRAVVSTSSTQLTASTGPGHMKTVSLVTEGAAWLAERVASTAGKFDAAALEAALVGLRSSYLASWEGK